MSELSFFVLSPPRIYVTPFESMNKEIIIFWVGISLNVFVLKLKFYQIKHNIF